MKPKIGDGNDGGDDGTPRPIHPPPPKTGGGGTVIPPPPPNYRAADGSPVSVQLFADGGIQSAEATGKDGILRRYSMATNRSVQTFSAGALPPLTFSVGLVKQRGIVRLTATANGVQLVYEIFCTNPEDAPPASADFQVSATRSENGTQISHDVRSVVGSSIQSDFESTFANVLGVQYEQLILFFQPVLRTVVVPRPATAQDRSVWGKLGRGVVWGIVTLVGGFLAAPVEGLGLIVYAAYFGLGFDASVWSDIITDIENGNLQIGDGGGSGYGGGGGEGASGTGGGTGAGGTAGGGGDGCFVEGTLVHVDRGLIPIEQAKADEAILAFDLSAGTIVSRSITRVFESEKDEIVVLCFDTGEEVRCTPPHRFYTDRWVAAKDLLIGDAVLAHDGSRHVLVAIAPERASRPVFNLAVSVTHTYLVGRAGLVVHNTKDNGTNTDDANSDTEQDSPGPKKK